MSYRRALWELAAENHGIVTAAEVEAIGIPASALRQLAHNGVLRRVGLGTYQHLDIPADEWTPYAARLAACGPDTYLVDDTVLSLHQLADVNPYRIHVATPHRRRRTIPPDTVLTQEGTAAADEQVMYHGLASQTVHRALLRAVPRLLPERVRDGVREALKRHLITERQAQQVRSALRRRVKSAG